MSKFQKYLKDGNVFVRKCDNCGCGMIEGYMKGHGDEYICSDNCLFRNKLGQFNGYSEKMRDEDYEDNYIFWTDWEIDARDLDDEGGFYDSTGKFIEIPKLSASDKKALAQSYQPQEVA